MGKRIVSQRRGRGTSTYISPSHRFITAVKHKPVSEKPLTGIIKDLIHCPGHTAPLAKVNYDDGTKGHIFVTEGMKIGDKIIMGKTAPIKSGNILPLGNIPEGELISNIEALPGDGGKFVRSSGVFARVVAKSDKKVSVLMPSKKKKDFDIKCRAMIGIIAGGGRKEKPFVKAGNRFKAMRARGRLYPITSKVAMNPVDHPFGCGRGRHEGKSTVAPRNAPPGRKVGQVKARRTGKRK